MKNKKILLLVDPLNDFADKNGSLYVPGGEEIITEINKLMNDVNFEHIILIQDYHPKEHKSFASNNNIDVFSIIQLNGIEQVMWPNHCIQDTWGCQPHPKLDKKWSHVVRKGQNIETDSYSAFYENDGKTKTEIFNIFNNLNVNIDDEIYIVGLATEYCVKYTTLDAKKIYNNVFLLPDCIRGINKADEEKTFKVFKEKDIKFK